MSDVTNFPNGIAGPLIGSVTPADGDNMPLGTVTGTKIGTDVAQKLGFWNATPVIQPKGATQAALSACTTVGSNTGTPAAGLSLIADTTSVNGAAAIMNDLASLQRDIAAAVVLINALRAALVLAGSIKGAA